MLRKYFAICMFCFTLILSVHGSDASTYLAEYRKYDNSLIAAISGAGGTVVKNWSEVKILVIRSDNPDFAATLKRNSNITGVEKDILLQWVVKPQASGKQRLSGSERFRATGSPFDAALLPFQWNLPITQANDAWNITTGSPAVKVAVLDTGFCSHHIDTTGKLDTAHSAAFISETHPVCTAAVAACPDCPAWEDYNFHGTHVASIIASNNIGTASVAPDVTLRAIKVLDCTGSGSFENVIGGTLFAVATGNDIINLSLGLPFAKNSFPGSGFLVGLLNKVANYANSKGVLIVTGAGNNAIDLDHDGNLTFVPCQSGSGLCVGSTGIDDQLAYYSNHGLSGPQVVAPGGGETSSLDFILGVCAPHQAVLPFACSSSDYLFVSGTSQATPHVAGAAALVDSVSPKGPGRASPAQIRSSILQGLEDLGAPGADNTFSNGRLNVLRALD